MAETATACTGAEEWLQHLYGAHTTGWLTLFSQNRNDGSRHTDWAPIDDVACLCAAAGQRASTCCVWFGVATRKEPLDAGRRGGADDCLEIPALWVDIDIAGPNHKGAHQLPPTIAKAAELLNDFPLLPTAVVRSGGGLQGWWLFHEPLAADKTAEDLLAAWGATWDELGRRRGWHVDNVFDVARIMRLPGTVNRKTAPTPVTAKAHWDRRYNPSDFEPHLLERPASPEPTRQIPYIGPERPGDAFNAVRRGGDVLAAARFTLGRSDRASGEEHWTRPGKNPKDGHSATVYADGHTTLWSDTVLGTWPAAELRRPYDPFGLFVVLFHQGDFRSASDDLAAQGYGTKAKAADDFSWVPASAHHSPPGAAEDVEDTPIVPETVPWPLLAPEALHGPLGAIVRGLEPHTEADPAGILASLLAYFAAALGAGPHFRLSGARQAARLDVLVVGDSARARKGSAEAMARWVMRHADKGIADTRRMNGLNSGEGLIEAVRDPKWGRDKKGNEILLDAGVDDKRLFLFEPEFAGRLMPAVRRQGSTVSALLRMAWDEGDLQTMNVRNPLRATGAHICVLGNTTIPELVSQITDTDLAGGLLNRFLFFAVRSVRRLPFGGTLEDADVAELARPLTHALDVARRRTQIQFGASCHDTWPAAYEALMDDVPDGPIGHLTARGPVQVQRLALIFALADSADTIEVEHLEAGLHVWDYCTRSAELVLAAEGNLTGDRDGDILLHFLVESGKAWPVSTLRAEVGNWGGTRLAAVRARLEKAGLVKVWQVPRSGGGRPTTWVEAR